VGACGESAKKSSSPKAIQVREWRVILMRYRGEFLGYVKAASPDAAEIEAAKTFNLNEWQRRRLLLREQA
jgi:hypothetical protein